VPPSPSRRPLWLLGALLPGVLLFASSAARAEDGRFEINAARALAGGVTPGDGPGFPVEIDRSGSYVLTGDLAVPAGVSGILILAGDVSLDLGGFSVRGPVSCTISSCPSSSARGIAASPSTVLGTSVENGSVGGFGSDCLALGPSARVERISVSNCGARGIGAGARSLVLDSAVDAVGADGIALVEPGVVGGNTIGSVGRASAGAPSISGGAATRGNVCTDDGCSRRARRRFYLTQEASFGPLQVLSACAPGFHMASIYELIDPSLLEYDPLLGDARESSPTGPIAGNSGWIRSGGSTSTTVNCSAWTSNSSAHTGTVAVLAGGVTGMNGAATHASPWSVFTTGVCGPSGIGGDGSLNHVWCVED
jgi:hypothetical protein